MHIPTRALRRSLIYQVHLVLLIPALIAWVYVLGDLALHLRIAETDTGFEIMKRVIAGLVISPLTVGVGLLCMRRSPRNIVGAILALWGTGIAEIINEHTYMMPTGIQVVLSAYAGVIWSACFFLFWYFPDGKVYPPRVGKWMDRLVLITYAASLLVGVTSAKLSNSVLDNPLFVASLAPLNALFTFVGGTGAAVGLFGGVISQVLRFRVANSHIRQQTKWLLWCIVPLVALALFQLFLQIAAPDASDVRTFMATILPLFIMVFPVVAIGNAILRHRLYDIDIIIRRTLIYSVLTAILAVIYFGGVIVVQQVLRPLTQSSDLAIVFSTLVIAALFNPLRHRIQNIIDRRFFRRKYDAQKTLEAFSIATRDEVDLDKLKAELVGVAQTTMQPTQIALWIKE